MRTLVTTLAIGMAVIAPAAAAEARAPVTRAEASLAAQRLAEDAATKLEEQSATGIEILTRAAVADTQDSRRAPTEEAPRATRSCGEVAFA
jgi:hypothetical protein